MLYKKYLKTYYQFKKREDINLLYNLDLMVK